MNRCRYTCSCLSWCKFNQHTVKLQLFRMKMEESITGTENLYFGQPRIILNFGCAWKIQCFNECNMMSGKGFPHSTGKKNIQFLICDALLEQEASGRNKIQALLDESSAPARVYSCDKSYRFLWISFTSFQRSTATVPSNFCCHGVVNL